MVMNLKGEVNSIKKDIYHSENQNEQLQNQIFTQVKSLGCIRFGVYFLGLRRALVRQAATRWLTHQRHGSVTELSLYMRHKPELPD